MTEAERYSIVLLVGYKQEKAGPAVKEGLPINSK
jgi:hypothetical protein